MVQLFMTLSHLASTPSLLRGILALPLVILTVCLLTWLTTSWRFARRIAQFKSRPSSPSSAQSQPIPPPVLPYALPWLGSALAFLNENPGSFWKMLRARLARTGANVQVCTILLGGKRTHVVNSAAAVQALFKSKHVSRDLFNHQLATQGLGTSKRDAELMFPPSTENPTAVEKTKTDKKDSMEGLNHEFLLSQTAVNSLTSKFLEQFRSALENADLDHEWKTIDLLSWLKKIMFDASTTAVLGSKILEMNPNLAEQFWDYDAGFLARFYGIPRYVKPDAYASLDKMLDQTEAWVDHALAEHGGSPPEEPEWEPLMGAKIVRARHRFYEREGLSSRGKAAFDLGFLFA